MPKPLLNPHLTLEELQSQYAPDSGISDFVSGSYTDFQGQVDDNGSPIKTLVLYDRTFATVSEAQARGALDEYGQSQKTGAFIYEVTPPLKHIAAPRQIAPGQYALNGTYYIDALWALNLMAIDSPTSDDAILRPKSRSTNALVADQSEFIGAPIAIDDSVRSEFQTGKFYIQIYKPFDYVIIPRPKSQPWRISDFSGMLFFASAALPGLFLTAPATESLAVAGEASAPVGSGIGGSSVELASVDIGAQVTGVETALPDLGIEASAPIASETSTSFLPKTLADLLPDLPQTTLNDLVPESLQRSLPGSVGSTSLASAAEGVSLSGLAEKIYTGLGIGGPKPPYNANATPVTKPKFPDQVFGVSMPVFIIGSVLLLCGIFFVIRR